MKLLQRLEKSLARFAVPHITLYIIFLQSLVYVLQMAGGTRNHEGGLALVKALSLDGQYVWHEPWRLLTFVFIPEPTNPLFFAFNMYLLYLFGSAMENRWGTLRFNIYLLIGCLATAAVGCAMPEGQLTSSKYVLESVFLAFAYIYPEFVLLVYFVFPVQAKWIALATWALYIYQFCQGDALQKCLIIAAVSNFLLFFHQELWQSIKMGRKRMVSRQGRYAGPVDEPFHRCTICGVTDQSDRRMEFRYCGECAGTPCYCINHIASHSHRTSMPAEPT